MSILDILNEIAATPSTNAKEAIIRREKDKTTLRAVFAAAYDPTISYYIRKIPTYTPDSDGEGVRLSVAIDELSALSSRKVTGDAGIEFLRDLLNNLDSDDAKVIERIIDRDLRCGCSDSIASRVWPGLVPTFDVMLSHKDISGIKFPAYAQIKSDGARCHMMLRGSAAMAFSRNGKPIELHGTFDALLAKTINEGETLDGELLAVDKDGKVLDRKTGNGIVNKAVKGTISKEEAEMLIFATWDIVDFTSTIPYTTRIERLTKAVTSGHKIHVLQTSIVNNEAEAQAFFEQCVSQGEEGAMIKNINAVWVPKRTKDLGKMKAEEVADLVIVGLEEGAGKYAGKLGALVCETSDGKLRVNVGSGFSDEDRKEYWSNQMVGKVIEVMYNQKIQDKNGGQASLFLPRFLSVRIDKNIANSFDELK
jgi:ATP-dependent DNA ligase